VRNVPQWSCGWHPDELVSPLPRAAFWEIQLAARLNHPHILPVYDSGDAGGCLYFVMPVMKGQTLRDLLATARHAACSLDTLSLTP